jgi:hypothetical protein
VRSRTKRALGVGKRVPQVAWVVEDPQRDICSRTILFHYPAVGAKHPTWVNTNRLANFDLVLYDSQGNPLLRSRETIHPYQTAVLETSDLLKRSGAKPPFHGQLFLSLHQYDWGSLRAYVHWYNNNAITSTHERAYSSKILGNHYYTVQKAVCHLRKNCEIYVALVNIDPKRSYSLEFVLQTDEGERRTSVHRAIAPNGALFTSVYDLFPNWYDVLKEGMGSIYLTNTDASLTIYYFTLNEGTQAWQAQHI